MALNNVSTTPLSAPERHPVIQAARQIAWLAIALGLSACSVTGPRESPLNEVTKDSPSALEIYKNMSVGSSRDAKARDALITQGNTQAVSAQDGQKSPYWNPLEPLRSRFTRVPNPDLVMVVYPHLAKGKYPVPGYVTAFPMYEENLYALPGEIEQDAIVTRNRYSTQQSAGAAAVGATAAPATVSPTTSTAGK